MGFLSKTLSKVVKILTGNTVEEQLKIDAMKLLEDAESFEKAAIEEQYDIKGLLPFLLELYPDLIGKEYKKNTFKGIFLLCSNNCSC